jgi:hypothetical protein
VQADYTSQLKAIAEALRHTSPPWEPWLLAAFSAALGVVGGFVGQALMTFFSEARKLRTMRLMLYRDVTEICAFLDVIARRGDETDANIGTLTARLAGSVIAKEFVIANRDLYIRIPERQSYDVICKFHDQVLQATPEVLDERVRSALQIIALQFDRHRMDLEYVRKHFTTEDFELFKGILPRYRTE